jgi:hypothetical protein
MSSSILPAAEHREILQRVVAEARPRRVAVLGGSTGIELGGVEPRIHVVYGAADAELSDGPYDLVHVALLLDDGDPLPLLRRIDAALGPSGTLSVLTASDEIVALVQTAGFALASRRTVKLSTGNALVSAIFDKVRKPLDRRRGRTRC